MGIIQHDAIVVVSWDDAFVEEARAFAVSTGLEVSEVSPVLTNGYRAFCVFPDGSKEGWEESRLGDARRAEIVSYLEDRGHCYWASVSMGELGTNVRTSKDDDDSRVKQLEAELEEAYMEIRQQTFASRVVYNRELVERADARSPERLKEQGHEQSDR